ncbi:uncharacterized protein LOC144107215 [Amblyomma americanum]
MASRSDTKFEAPALVYCGVQSASTKPETSVVVKTSRAKRRRGKRLDFTLPHAERRRPQTRAKAKHSGGNQGSQSSTRKSVRKPPEHDAAPARRPHPKTNFKDHTTTTAGRTTTPSAPTSTATESTKTATRTTTTTARSTTPATSATATATVAVANTTSAATATANTTKAPSTESSTTTSPTTRQTGEATSTSATSKDGEVIATSSATGKTSAEATPATGDSAGSSEAEASSKTWTRAIIKALSVKARGPASTKAATQSPLPLTKKIITAKGVVRGVEAVAPMARRTAAPSKQATSLPGAGTERRASSSPQDQPAAPKLGATSSTGKATTKGAAPTAVPGSSPAVPTRREAASTSPGAARHAA